MLSGDSSRVSVQYCGQVHEHHPTLDYLGQLHMLSWFLDAGRSKHRHRRAPNSRAGQKVSPRPVSIRPRQHRLGCGCPRNTNLVVVHEVEAFEDEADSSLRLSTRITQAPVSLGDTEIVPAEHGGGNWALGCLSHCLVPPAKLWAGEQHNPHIPLAAVGDRRLRRLITGEVFIDFEVRLQHAEFVVQPLTGAEQDWKAAEQNRTAGGERT